MIIGHYFMDIFRVKKMTDEEEEKLNGLINKISFALKDATLQQGFEIICKRISELESDLKVARYDRKNLEMEVGRGLREYIKDCPYSALKNFADAKIVDENEQLKKKLDFFLTETVAGKEYRPKEELDELKSQIEKMKSITEDLIKIQSLSIEDNYNAGLFNGFVTVFNSIFEEKYQCCKWNENKNKWELAE